MNTIKFSKINEMRKETSDVSIYKIKKIKIGEKEYEYFGDTQICLYITKLCNANCKFCINKYNKIFVSSNPDLEENIYLEKLEQYLNLFGKDKPYITITGGEPTKDKKLISVLKFLKEKEYKIRTFGTNGSGLLELYNNRPVLDYMREIYINSINLSRAAIQDEKNDRLMCMKKGDITNEKIKEIANYTKYNNMELRMSCVLLRDGVNDLKSLLEYKNFYNKYGINSILYRELLETSITSYHNFKVDIKNIFKEIENNDEFRYLKTLEGKYYKVKIYQYKDEIVKCYEEKEATIEDEKIIRDFFILPDMKLVDGYNNKILME